MYLEALSAPVRFPTLRALKGHFPCVESLVRNEGDIVLEGFATLATPVRLLSGVHSEMLHEKGLLAEGLPTLAALEGLLPSVYLPVPIEVGDAGKDLATVSAFAVPLLTVNSLSTLSVRGRLPAPGSHLMPEKTRGGLQDRHTVRAEQGGLSTAQRLLV